MCERKIRVADMSSVKILIIKFTVAFIYKILHEIYFFLNKNIETKKKTFY